MEHFFAASGTLLPSRNSPPLPFIPEDIAHMISIAPEYGIDILVPPP